MSYRGEKFSMTHYDLLSVSPDATTEEIKEAHRIAVQLLHPDQLRQKPSNVRKYAEERLKKINEAYVVLRDPVKRRKYDGSIGVADSNQAHTSNSAPIRRRKTTSQQPAYQIREEEEDASFAVSLSRILNEYIFVFSLLGLIVGISIQYYGSYLRCTPEAQNLLQLWHHLMQCDLNFIAAPVKGATQAPLQIVGLIASIPLAGLRMIYTFFLPVILGSVIAILCKADYRVLNIKEITTKGVKKALYMLSYVIAGGIFVVLFYPIYILIKGLTPLAFQNEGALDTANLIGLITLYAVILFINASGIIVSINEPEQ